VIIAKQVKKVYRRGKQEVRALDGVDLEIKTGEFLGIMGSSGSGKSTLLHLIGALDTPTSGDIIIDGRTLSQASDAELTRLRRSKIGFVFQFFNLLPTMTALENIAFPALLEGATPADARGRASALLARVGLAGRGDHHPDELSGGEMQRVAIARALVKDAPILLADEPTGNLDSASGREILELLRGLHRDGLTIVMVTHDRSAAETADRIVEMRDGTVIDDSRTPG
jgi:putative ABC transport system ATP-binding protein